MSNAGSITDTSEYESNLKTQAHLLVEKLDTGDFGSAFKIIQDINSERDQSLFNEVGRLTRALHTSIVEFHIDSDLDEDDENGEGDVSQMSDASDRLNYVIDLTNKAANKTLDKVDECAPIAENLGTEASALRVEWSRLLRRELNPDEFRQLYQRIDVFLQDTESSAVNLHTKLTDILMAQDYQDLTGQVITRVIGLVKEVEEHLVDLVKMASLVDNITGISHTNLNVDKKKKAVEAEGPQIHADQRDDVVSGQDDVDELLSSLGF